VPVVDVVTFMKQCSDDNLPLCEQLGSLDVS
jgi:hypothetical protein